MGVCHCVNPQDASQRLHLALLLQRTPLVTQAILVSCKGPKFFDVFVPQLGCEARVDVCCITPRPLDASWDRASMCVRLLCACVCVCGGVLLMWRLA